MQVMLDSEGTELVHVDQMAFVESQDNDMCLPDSSSCPQSMQIVLKRKLKEW